MKADLSDNAKAILLLCAPLIIGKQTESLKILTAKEYHFLARHLYDHGNTPGDLLDSSQRDSLLLKYPEIERTRIISLLGRGFLLSQALERWTTRAIWVLSRADKGYPSRIKDRLKESAPPVIYGCGNRNELEMGGIAIVGSRQVDEELTEYTHSIAVLAAQARQNVISGGARGIDQTAMTSALNAGGNVIGVLSDSLEKAVMNRTQRNYILTEQLVLISPYDPAAGFNVGNAMSRNKLIYSLSDIALVVNSDYNKGGTWAGAVEELRRKRSTVFIRSTGKQSRGLDELKKLGAVSWPDPKSNEELIALFEHNNGPTNKQQGLFAENVSDLQTRILDGKSGNSEPISISLMEPPGVYKQPESYAVCPSQEIYSVASGIILSNLSAGKSASEIADILEVNKSQAQEWLDRLVKDGAIVKETKPIRYFLRDKGLFQD